MRNKSSKYKSKSQASHSGVQAKKHLGQHFLANEDIAKQIAEVLTYSGYENVIEVGPGTGVLTKYILRNDCKVYALELDRESVTYLKHSFRLDHPKVVSDKNFKVVETDFLKQDLNDIIPELPYAIIGNFPYNISTQIVFKTLENRERIPEFGGMFQKEVAQRICADHGSKTYGILSVLTQAYYEAEYLFTVSPQVFNPPPRVHSGVLILKRKSNFNELPCSYEKLRQVVKLAFQQRRKTLRNSLKSLQLPDELREQELFNLRPEQMSVTMFIDLTATIEKL